jgi:hypothetical protein
MDGPAAHEIDRFASARIRVSSEATVLQSVVEALFLKICLFLKLGITPFR